MINIEYPATTEERKTVLLALKTEFMTRVLQTFPACGLDPNRVMLHTWWQHDDDSTPAPYPVIGFRYTAVPLEIYRRTGCGTEQEEKWPCWTLSGNRLPGGLHFVLKMLYEHM